ncbi:MAG: CDP-alcohol phosphatidyltransferase family protein, partial [Victivallales bacterium]|nr:CDP-alcohol phosphatidyltransferase family protein [Victivallales bacterium]
MIQTIVIIAVVLAMLAFERTLVLTITSNPRCQSFIRHHFWLHPNGISCLRIPQGLIAILFAESGRWGWAILWFAFWMITDLTDGTIARKCDLATSTGEWLDPLADKCMTFPPLFYLAFGSSPNVVSPHLPVSWMLLYCALDIVGQFSRLFCQKKAANSFGKAKTALVTILISILAFYQFCLTQNHPLFPPLTSLTSMVVTRLMQACTILAFLSLYCKVVPSNWYANSLTFLNFLCGIFAIAIAWMPQRFPNNHILAFILIFLGQFFDLFDGRMARKYG